MPPSENLEARYRELRRTMQDIVIAHAAVCFQHMSREQLAAAQEEWARVVAGKGWEHFFIEDDGPLPAAPIVATPGQPSAEKSRDEAKEETAAPK